jgi:hypothetical protein
MLKIRRTKIISAQIVMTLVKLISQNISMVFCPLVYFWYRKLGWAVRYLRLASALVVLVVPAKPRHRFVPPIRCPIEPLVHSPKRIEAARVGGVCVVDNAVGECERTHSRSLASVCLDVGASHGRKSARGQRVLTVL